ncbi:MAG: DUF58 domain-containing protein [Pedobacter sp.]|nr:MAG: DUF58 domain-containing protein [Pedobacter sp.]
MASLNDLSYADALVNLELLARQVVEGFITGLHKSPFHGFSVEFAEHRAYNPGDNIKNIDWKLYAKTDKLFVKRFEEETNLRCQLVIDTSSSMYFPRDSTVNKLQFAVRSAASLMYLLKRQRDAFGLSLFDETLYTHTKAASTTAHTKYMYGHLETALKASKLNTQTNIESALHQVAEAIPKRSLIILFSDMLNTALDDEKTAAIFAAIQHLKFNKHEIVIFNITDHAREVNFEFENRPYQFVDMESGKILKVQPHQVKESYLNNMATYRNKLQLKCAQYHIDLVDADIAKGYETVLQAYLIKRQKML